MPKPNELRILMLDDNVDDVFLTARALEQGNVKCQIAHAATKDDFIAHLEAQRPDVILSDHGLPAFDGFTALETARMRCPNTPFIFVSGSMDDNSVVDAFDRGASDFVAKSQLATLACSIKRAVEFAEERLEWKRTEEALRNKIEDLQEIINERRRLDGLVYICASCKKMKDEQSNWTMLEKFLHERTDATFSHGICADCAKEFYAQATRLT